MQRLDSVTWLCRPFGHLATAELYAILALRQAVFVVEQRCAYQDADGLDQVATHLTGYEGANLVAYARILPAGTAHAALSIGRVVTHPGCRGTGLGGHLMRQAVRAARTGNPGAPIHISAQLHLADTFYAKLGFKRAGDAYEEDGIPHIGMLLPAPA